MARTSSSSGKRRRDYAALRAERDAALRDQVAEGVTRTRRKLDEAGAAAAERLLGVIVGDQVADGPYVQALRLALQASGALVERVDATSAGQPMAAFVIPPKSNE